MRGQGRPGTVGQPTQCASRRQGLVRASLTFMLREYNLREQPPEAPKGPILGEHRAEFWLIAVFTFAVLWTAFAPIEVPRLLTVLHRYLGL